MTDTTTRLRGENLTLGYGKKKSGPPLREGRSFREANERDDQMS